TAGPGRRVDGRRVRAQATPAGLAGAAGAARRATGAAVGGGGRALPHAGAAGALRAARLPGLERAARPARRWSAAGARHPGRDVVVGLGDPARGADCRVAGVARAPVRAGLVGLAPASGLYAAERGRAVRRPAHRAAHLARIRAAAAADRLRLR